MAHTLRIFISSPGDVGQERVTADRVIQQLQGEFGGWTQIQTLLWEHEPVRATSTFQEQIVRPSDTDVVVCVLWSRLGTRLPAGFEQRPDGTAYESGTAFEFEDAKRSFEERGTPDLLVYRKTAEPLVSLRDAEQLGRMQSQWVALEAYLKRWFWNEDGTFKAGFTQFETVEEFEKLLDRHLRRLIRDKLDSAGVAMTEDGGALAWHRGSPFRGLEAFEFEHAPVFFGRTRAIGEIQEALIHHAARGRAFVLAFGMSGCGKSSLVRAGVLPLMTQPGVIEGVGLWRWCVFCPSDASGDLCDGLARMLIDKQVLPELTTAGARLEELAETFRSAPQRTIPFLRMGLARAAEEEARREGLTSPLEPRLALVIDQMEELFTLDRINHQDREAFVALLSALAGSGLVWIIATMRSDFYHRCAELPAMAALSQEGSQYHLLPPQRAEIGQMIRQPARAAGLIFEVDPTTGIGLDADIEEAAARDPAALPLLEFMLEELFKQRAKGHVLSINSYQTLGGLEGALAQRAEAVFADLEPTVQTALPEVLTALVTVAERDEKPAAARRVPLPSVALTAERKTLVEALVDARLLVTDRADDGTAVVRIAHEALLNHWPRVQNWLKENQEFLRTRGRVEAAAARWSQENRNTAYLLAPGKPLAEAEDMLARRRAELDSLVIAFISASIAKARRKQHWQRIFVVGVTILALVATWGAFLGIKGQREAEKQFQHAVARGFVTQAEMVRNQQDYSGQPSVLLAVEAMQRFDSLDMRSVEADQALRQGIALLPHAVARMKHADKVRAVAFSPDGRHLATASDDNTARLLEVASLREMARVDHDDKVWAVAFSPDGRYLATASRDRTAGVWQVPDGGPVARIRHEGSVETVTFSPDGRYLATASRDRTACLWDLPAGRKVGCFKHEQGVGSVAFSPDGRYLATAGANFDPSGGISSTVYPTARPTESLVWEVSSGREVTRLLNEDGIWAAAFSPDGRYLARVSGGTVAVSEVASGSTLEMAPKGNDSALRAIAFSPNSRYLAAAGYEDGTARVWQVADGQLIKSIHHGESLTFIAYSPDGQYLATAGWDRTARVWEVLSGREVARMSHEDLVWAVAFSPDGQYVATASWDGTAQVWAWQTASGQALRIEHEEGGLMAFTPDGRFLATASPEFTATGDEVAEGHLNVWAVDNDRKVLDIDSEDVMKTTAIAFSPDGRFLATVHGADGGFSWDAEHRIHFGPARQTLLVWEVGSGREVIRLHQEYPVSDVAFSPDGELLATASVDRIARVWEVVGGREASHIEHDNVVSSVTFSPDGQHLATATGYNRVMVPYDDGEIELLSEKSTTQIWEVSSSKAVTRIPHDDLVRAVAFSPDGQYVATVGDSLNGRLWTARVWNMSDGSAVAHMDHSTYLIETVAFSPDSKYLATASLDHIIRVWAVTDSNREVARMQHENEVQAVAFSPQGRHLLSVSRDRQTLKIQRWLWWTDDLIEDACNRLTRNLSRTEWRKYAGEKLPYHITCANLPVPEG